VVETQAHKIFNIPYFLMQSLIDSNNKVNKWNSQQLAHHGVIKILIEDSLQKLRIPITWSVFKDLPIEDDIKTLTYDVSPSFSERKENKKKKI